MQRIEARTAVSLAELEENTSGVLDEAPADTDEALLDRLDDLDLVNIVQSRSGETGIPVHLDDLSA